MLNNSLPFIVVRSEKKRCREFESLFSLNRPKKKKKKKEEEKKNITRYFPSKIFQLFILLKMWH